MSSLEYLASPGLWAKHSPLYTPHFALHTSHSTLHISTFQTPDSSLDALHSTPHTLHSTLYPSNFILYNLFSTLCIEILKRELLLHKMCLDICVSNIRVSIRNRGFHLVFFFNHQSIWAFFFFFTLLTQI